MSHPRSKVFVAALALSLIAAACAPREGDDIGSPVFNGTTPEGEIVEPPISTLPAPEINAIRVPVDAGSIQEAVDRAQPGDLVLVDPGIYTEQVTVRTPDIVIRGRNRNTVFVDGLHEIGTGFTVLADGVALENMTVRNYTADAIVVDGTAGPARNRFRALHITTSNSDGSGIALRSVTNAEVRQGWFSGHGDAGVSVESCANCSTLITLSLAEFSARGFSITGASEGVTVFASTSRNNRAGIIIEDGDQPSSGVTIAGTLIQNNGFTQSPNNTDAWDTFFGVGAQVGGTFATTLTANRVVGNTRAGVLLTQNLLATSNDPVGTNVSNNIIVDHPEGDVVLAAANGIADPGLCILDNVGAVLSPEGVAAASTCTESNTAAPISVWSGGPRDSIPHQNVQIPPEIDGMANPDSEPPTPAGPVQLPDPSSAVVPDA